MRVSDVRVADMPTVTAMSNMRRAVAADAKHDRHQREQSAESETGEKDGFHGRQPWLVGVLLVCWGVNRMYGGDRVLVARWRVRAFARGAVPSARAALAPSTTHVIVSEAEGSASYCPAAKARAFNPLHVILERSEGSIVRAEYLFVVDHGARILRFAQG